MINSKSCWVAVAVLALGLSCPLGAETTETTPATTHHHASTHSHQSSAKAHHSSRGHRKGHSAHAHSAHSKPKAAVPAQ